MKGLFREFELRHKICFPVLIFLCSFTGDCGPEEAHAKANKVRVGDKFPRIELFVLTKTEKFDSNQTKGKVAVIDFWASDCEPCREAVPELNTLNRHFKKEPVIFVGINVDEDSKHTSAFLSEFKPLYVLLDDSKHKFISNLGVEAMPTTYVVDKKGVVRYINKGFRSGDAEKLKHEILKQLK